MAATTTGAPRSRDVTDVPTRRMSFEDHLTDLPRHFAADGDILGSHLMAALSAVFPDGEDYFVRSVRRFRDRVTDPVLRRQVAGFIGQESVHGREHRVLNERLAELGYPTRHVERLVRAGLAVRERLTSAKGNLAVTAALEHFTATLAEVVLTSEEVREHMGHPEIRDIFVWHALEELEHKAVAFDVYRAVGGTERMRIWTMRLVRVGFLVGMTAQMLVSLALDPAARNPRRMRDSWRRFRRSPLVSRRVWRMLKAYDRPGFHPDDRDTTELVATWRERLFGDGGELNDHLVGRAA